VSQLKLENAIGLLFAYDSGEAITCALLEVRTEGSSERCVVADAFIPIYPNALPTVHQTVQSQPNGVFSCQQLRGEPERNHPFAKPL
jgi:hypothetical protein